MTMRASAAGGCLLATTLLFGCEDPALDRGSAPPVVVAQSQVAVPLHGYAPARGLRQALASLTPDGNARLVDATVETVSGPQAASAKALLVELGLDPARIAWHGNAREDILLRRSTAQTLSCATAVRPGWLGDAQRSAQPLGECIQANALAQMVADPGDLVHPVPLGPTNGAVAARAVGQWQAGTVAPAQQSRSDEGHDGGDTGGPDSDASPSAGVPPAAAPVHSSGVEGNPLLAPLPGARAE